MGKTSFKEGQVSKAHLKKGTCRAAANQSPPWQGVSPSTQTPLWLAGTYRPSRQVPRSPCKTAPWPDKSRSTLWGPDVYLRAAMRYASIAATFLSLATTKLAPARARRNGHAAKKNSSSSQVNLKQAPASLPSRANTAQLPVRAGCIARCTCNSHCIQPLVPVLVSATWNRAWTDSAAAERPGLVQCDAMPCKARTAATHISIGMGARKETPQLAAI